jgi:hypothetical protein
MHVFVEGEIVEMVGERSSTQRLPWHGVRTSRERDFTIASRGP